MLLHDSPQRPPFDPARIHGATLIGLLIALAVVALTSTATRVLRGCASVSPRRDAWVRIGNARRAASVSGRPVSITIPLEHGIGIIIARPGGQVVGDSSGRVVEQVNSETR